MSNPRKQHYVPQVYLNNFAYGKDKNLKLYVLSCKSNKIYPANVRDSASERDFYTLDGYEDKFIWERHYATCIEPILGDIIKTIRQRCENVLVQNQAIVMDPDEKFRLALSMIFQLLRGKQTRDYEQYLYNKLLPKVAEQTRTRFAPLDEKQEALVRSFGDENKYFKEISMQSIFRKESVEKFVSILLQRSFVIYKIVGTYSFVTSDNPVLLINLDSHDATPFKNGLANSKTVVYYPLSPKLLLGAYHPHLYFGSLESIDCQMVIIDGSKEQRFVLTHNKKQKEQSNYVYAQSKEILQML